MLTQQYSIFYIFDGCRRATRASVITNNNNCDTTSTSDPPRTFGVVCENAFFKR